MTSPPTLDFEALLRPIEGDKPTGEDLRGDPSPTSPYYEIKDARASARAAERSGAMFEAGQQLVSSDWVKVLTLGPQILTDKAKDLEIVAWLTEALVRQHGFTGLRDGFRLARELVEQFWDDLYPEPDEDGVSTKVAPLAGLSGGDAEGTLSVPIALAPITEDGEFGVFGLWRYSKARELSKLEDPDAIAEAVANGGASMDQFDATIRSTSPDFFRDLVGDIEEALEHFNVLTNILDEKCGHDAPPSSNLRNTLKDALQTVSHVAQNLAGVPLAQDEPVEDAEAAGEDGDDAARPQAAAPVAAPGAINTREDAFRMIGKVADFFRQTEPHSPLSSLLAQAVRWGRMPLHQLIEELIPDSDARDRFGLVTGLKSGSSVRAGDDDDE